MPERTGGSNFIAAYTAVMALQPINLDIDPYVRGMERAQRSMRRFEKRANHIVGSWRGDGVQPAETRQMRRAKARKAVKR
ncbi:MAG: hypothetical protein IT430_03940 [Phycisphaerales bacterium]|nr:hypothetical protein [Phycisphaerales bacterium]